MPFFEFQAVLAFWFDPANKSSWFKKDHAFDRLITEQFGDIHAAAVRAELWSWREKPEGRLAEVIVLDQFSRNMFRGDPRSFAFDPLALVLAQEAIAQETDKLLDPDRRQFLYMPFMHSESLLVHDRAVELFGSLETEDNLRHELRHLDILKRFGRYPHRNEILGRSSTDEELAFLAQPGSRF